MDEKIEIMISQAQKKLLQEAVRDDIIDSDIDRAVSAVVSKAGKSYIYLDPSELDDLVGTICFIANHEEDNPKLVRQLDKLAEYLGKFLEYSMSLKVWRIE